jgi:RNA polymerase sigma-70 factor (ECF subfamily)
MPALALESHASIRAKIADARPDLLRAARALVGSTEAEDLVQNTLTRALEHVGSFRTDTNLFAWLKRILSNLTVDSWRRANRYPLCPLDEQKEPDHTEDVPHHAWEELTAADLCAATAALSPRFRKVFELYQQGMPYGEIARRLDLPLGTVGTRLLRARTQLRAILTGVLTQRAAAAAAPRPLQMSISARQLGPLSYANDQRPAHGPLVLLSAMI